jgi:beta-galactosidase/beta-glucuronidase
MAVPASFHDIAADAAVRDYFGDVWYQRTVWVPRGWQGRRIVLHFGALDPSHHHPMLAPKASPSR